MAACPFCGSTDVEKPFFAGKPLPGSPEPVFGQVFKHQKCRKCRKFFEPKLPGPVFAVLIALTFAIAIFIAVADRIVNKNVPFTEYAQSLTTGKIGFVIFFLAAIVAIGRRKTQP